MSGKEIKLIELLKSLGAYPESSYGEVLIKVHEGKITLVKLTETIKIGVKQ